MHVHVYSSHEEILLSGEGVEKMKKSIHKCTHTHQYILTRTYIHTFMYTYILTYMRTYAVRTKTSF